jgi:hypothetical protein
MKQPYLVQRAKFQSSDSKRGIDSILSFDYMGAAEFEWGSLPESLKRIRESLSKYVYFTYTLEGTADKTVVIFCKDEDREQIPAFVEGLAVRAYRLQEHCDLADWVHPDNFSSKNPNDFWWDIEHDFIFWKEDPEFETKFKEAINQMG